MKIFASNLTRSFGDDDLRRLFAAYGNVVSAKVAIDHESGRSKGFGFVEMGSVAAARSAITGLNGKEVGGRSLIVVKAQEKPAPNGGTKTGQRRRSARTSPRKPAPLGKRLRQPHRP